jgi:hypothetical protein
MFLDKSKNTRRRPLAPPFTVGIDNTKKLEDQILNRKMSYVHELNNSHGYQLAREIYLIQQK